MVAQIAPLRNPDVMTGAWLTCRRARGGRSATTLGCAPFPRRGRPFARCATACSIPAVNASTLSKPATGAARGLRQDRPIFGIALINAAVVIFTAMDAVIKGVSETFPTGQLVFFRNLFAFGPILIFMLHQSQVQLRTRHAVGHLLRGLFGVSAMYCYFLSYKLLPLSEAIALGLSGPIFLTVLSIPFLGERVGLRRWSACIVGFLGVLVMTRPNFATGGAGVWQPEALVPLLAAVFYALAMISIRKLTATEASGTIVFYFTLFATLAGLATAPLGAVDPELAWVWPAGGEWLIVLTIGLMGGCGQILITIAFRSAPVSVVAPFDYMALVYGFLLGWMVFEEVPDWYLMIGGATVVASGIYIVHREAVVARQRRRQQAESPLPVDA
jgi:drug/metabolite transporter (DMT)-like permease